MRESSTNADYAGSIGRRGFLAAVTAATASASGCLSALRSDSPDDADSGPGESNDSSPASDADDDSDADSGDDGPPTVDHPAEIEVPGESVLDRRVDVAITGLDAGQRVELAFRTDDPGGSGEWSGSATFDADDDGAIRLADAAPVEGSYDAADPMGPFWSMTTDLPASRAAFTHETHEVAFEVRTTDGASVDGVDGPAVLASATTTRSGTEPRTEPLGEELVGTVYLPDDEGPAPGVLALHGSGGQELDHVGRLLASRGYVAASLQYFGDPEPIPTQLAEVPLEYVQRAVDALAGHDRTAAGDVGVYGTSKGAELALLSGVHLDGVGAVASVVGSAHVWEGLNQNWRPSGTSSWSLDGEPLDAVPFTRSGGGSAETIRDSYERSLEEADESTVEAATIPVERIDAPLLLVSGGSDAMWPSTPYAEAVIDRLEVRDAADDVRHLQFEDAGHAITPPYVPTYGYGETRYYELGGTPAGNARAAAEYWPDVLDLLDRSLGAE